MVFLRSSRLLSSRPAVFTFICPKSFTCFGFRIKTNDIRCLLLDGELLVRLELVTEWMQTCLIFPAVCPAAGLVGHQCLPVRPFLHGLPGGEMVLHQSPAWGESAAASGLSLYDLVSR